MFERLMENIIVIKVGGAVVKNHEGLLSLLNLLQKYQSQKVVLVFSAFSNITRALKDSANLAKKDYPTAQDKILNIKSFFESLTKDLFESSELRKSIVSEIDNELGKLERILFAISVTKDFSLRILDKILSFGEKISAIFLKNFLKHNRINFDFIDAEEIIVTDDNFGSAKPIFELTKSNVEAKIPNLFAITNLVITQGFVGKTRNGEITTMGFESSNLTALLLSNILNARELNFVTDVEGIRSSDPKIVDKTKLIEEISFDFAKFLSQNNFKLIHPEMINFFESNSKTSYKYFSIFAPNKGLTKIVPKSRLHPPILLISGPYNMNFYVLNKHIPTQNHEKAMIINLLSTKIGIVNETNNKKYDIYILTLANFPVKETFESLSKIWEQIFGIFWSQSDGTFRIIVQSNHLKEVANYLHKIISK